MFKKYRRVSIAEMRPVTAQDIEDFNLSYFLLTENDNVISVSAADLDNGSPKIGDMIARNPINHDDQWLVAMQYFNDNFEEL